MAAGCILLLAGCAAPLPPQTGDPSANPPATEPGGDYLCGFTPVDADMLEARAPLSALSPAGSAALAGATIDDGSPFVLEEPDQWWIVSEGEHEIVFMRELGDHERDELEPVGLIGADHQLAAIQYIGDAPNAAPGWYVTGYGACSLTVDLGELSVPRVQLDPAALPTPDSTVLHLLITERDCNSGQDALGRVELVSIDEDATSVSLVVGVRPSGGGTCPSNPPTPFEVTLTEPLGERSILDAALAEPSPVTTWEPLG